MHFSSRIDRPPFEAESAYLQVTSGCSYRERCSFCTLFGKPSFSVSPWEEVEADLRELSFRRDLDTDRIFLQGADPFVLSYDRLMRLAELVHQHLPQIKTIGGYARVDNFCDKTEAQLKTLRGEGYTGLLIGVETGDDVLLERCCKGYTRADEFEQLSKLEPAGIEWSGTFLNGLGGRGYGTRSAIETASLYNEVRPQRVGIATLVVQTRTQLWSDMKYGEFKPCTGRELADELLALLDALDYETIFGLGNEGLPLKAVGPIPKYRERIRQMLVDFRNTVDEESLAAWHLSMSTLGEQLAGSPEPVGPKKPVAPPGTPQL